MAYKAPRGTRDILPEEAARWFQVESLFRELCARYGFGEIRTPIFEHTELFTRSVGEESDIVSKEMYTFQDRAARSLTLRPEGTAAVVRAYLEHNLSGGPQPVKLFYCGPMFRYDRPQAGRYRQFHQFGLETFGAAGPAADYEIIALTWEFISGSLGIAAADLELNSVGCPACRPAYRAALLAYGQPLQAAFCPDCRRRFSANPLRVLDCKEPGCREAVREAPRIEGSLCPDCGGHFADLQELLGRSGIPFKVNPLLVRGLDYYTRTAFEVVSREAHTQGSLAGGGRYDNLVEQCGGSPTPGVGVAFGVERLILAAEGKAPPPRGSASVFVAYTGRDLAAEAQALAREIRACGVPVEAELMGRSLKGQMKFAGRKGFRFVCILGEKEQARGKIIWRDMAGGAQEELAPEELRRRLGHCRSGSGEVKDV